MSCIGVKVTLDRAPSVGETATLTYTVRTGVKLAPSDITVELPTQLAWAQAPAGFIAGQATSVQPERSGTIATAQRKVQLRRQDGALVAKRIAATQEFAIVDSRRRSSCNADI